LRPIPARLAVTAALVVLGTFGCANRGMVAPHDGGGEDTSKAGGGGKGGSGGGGGGHGGASGAAGTAGIKDAGCSLLTDALVDHSTTNCSAKFNFESGTEGASLPAGTQAAFTGVVKSSTQTYCGTGALAISASFSGTTGNTTKGEVDLPLGTDGGTANVVGKTVTIHILVAPATCGGDLRLSVSLDTTIGEPVVLRLATLTSNWTTASVTLTADGGAASATKLALQAFSTSGYTGTIYLDEIDIR
jgi:hypothetical protein